MEKTDKEKIEEQKPNKEEQKSEISKTREQLINENPGLGAIC